MTKNINAARMGKMMSLAIRSQRTEVLEKRRLMTVDEVKQLSAKRILIFVEGLGYAIKAKKIFYYQDAYFKMRLLPPPPVPKLKLQDNKHRWPAPKQELVA